MRVGGLHGWFPYFIHTTQNPMRKKMNAVVYMVSSFAGVSRWGRAMMWPATHTSYEMRAYTPSHAFSEPPARGRWNACYTDTGPPVFVGCVYPARNCWSFWNGIQSHWPGSWPCLIFISLFVPHSRNAQTLMSPSSYTRVTIAAKSRVGYAPSAEPRVLKYTIRPTVGCIVSSEE